MKYGYKCISWQNGVKVAERLVIKSAEDFLVQHNAVGEIAVMRVINNWNASVASNGDNVNNLIHKYIYLGCE